MCRSDEGKNHLPSRGHRMPASDAKPTSIVGHWAIAQISHHSFSRINYEPLTHVNQAKEVNVNHVLPKAANLTSRPTTRHH